MGAAIGNKNCVGRIPWNKGLVGVQSWSKKSREKLSKTNTGKKHFYCRGKKHPLWKGDSVSYNTLHKWVKRWLGKAMKCMNNQTHFSTRYHWANISGEYKRNLNDWHSLCPKCNKNDGIKIANRFKEGECLHG